MCLAQGPHTLPNAQQSWRSNPIYAGSRPPPGHLSRGYIQSSFGQAHKTGIHCFIGGNFLVTL